MILKLLLIIGVISIIYFFFIKKKPALKSSRRNSNKPKDETQSSEMVECSTCGIYCEVSETLISNNKYYCSNECLEKA